MKSIITILLLSSLSFASFDTLRSFEANFTQSVTDDKNKALVYKGHVWASKPQSALWSYTKPIKKDVYLNRYKVTIVEPEIEQVIIRRIESNFDFFSMIKHAKQIKEDTYIAKHRDTEFTIIMKNKLIKSISYFDQFENSVKIIFEDQKQNTEIDSEIFIPEYPLSFDIIVD